MKLVCLGINISSINSKKKSYISLQQLEYVVHESVAGLLLMGLLVERLLVVVWMKSSLSF